MTPDYEIAARIRALFPLEGKSDFALVDALRREVGELLAEEKLQALHDEYEGELDSLRHNVVSAEEDLREEERENEDLRQKVEELEKKLDAKRCEVARLERELEEPRRAC
jgi:chromosome segregation ATPase